MSDDIRYCGQCREYELQLANAKAEIERLQKYLDDAREDANMLACALSNIANWPTATPSELRDLAHAALVKRAIG